MGLHWLRYCLSIGVVSIAAACAAQSATPPPVPANIPGPITPPRLLPGDDKPIPQCAGIQAAEVKLEFTVTPDGDPADMHVIASPSDKHSLCATETVRTYKYLPAMRDGKPLAIKLVLTITVQGK